MNSLLLLIPLSLLFLIVAGIALFWAVDRGQFDDMETPGFTPLDDAAGKPLRPPPEGGDEASR